MKRNNDLIRAILLYMEKNCTGSNKKSITVRDVISDFPDVTQDIINEHIKILSDSHFIEAEPTQLYWFLLRLTPAGYDFLQNSSDPHIWEKVKNVAGNFTLDVFGTVLKEYAVKCIMSALSK